TTGANAAWIRSSAPTRMIVPSSSGHRFTMPCAPVPWPRSGAIWETGGQMSVDERIERSRLLYEQALFESDAGALTAAERELEGVEADLALARGRVIHGRFLEQRAEDPKQAREDPRELALFERATQLYRARGDVRGEAESLFWVGCCHQVVRHDNEAAVPVLWRSLELATETDDPLTMSEALRHLGIAEHAAGRLEAARAHLEESTRL